MRKTGAFEIECPCTINIILISILLILFVELTQDSYLLRNKYSSYITSMVGNTARPHSHPHAMVEARGRKAGEETDNRVHASAQLLGCWFGALCSNEPTHKTTLLSRTLCAVSAPRAQNSIPCRPELEMSVFCTKAEDILPKLRRETSSIAPDHP